MTLPLDKFANQLDWNLLRTFVVIVQERSITQAAHRLFLTQPSVSGSLRRLEDRIGQRLIERGGATQFRVTEAGESLYRACLEIYGTIRALPEVLEEGTHNLQGTLALRISSHIHHAPLMQAVAEFVRLHPKVQFTIGGGSCADILDEMRRKKLDLAIVSLQREHQGALDQRLLTRMRMGLYGAPSTADAAESDLTRAAWIGDDEIRPDSAWDLLDHYRIRQRMEGPVVAQAQGCARMAELMAQGLGIGFLPCALADSMPGLRRIEMDPQVPSMPLFITLQQHTRSTALHQRFIDTLERAAGGGSASGEPS